MAMTFLATRPRCFLVERSLMLTIYDPTPVASGRGMTRRAVLRGVQLAHLHTANEFYSGYPWLEPSGASEPGEARRPALGSVVSRLRGAGSALPPYVSLNNPADWERAYYLGPEHEPFRAGD